MTRVVSGPAHCIECRAVWRVVHVTLSEEGCVRCGGDLTALDEHLELLPQRERERIFALPTGHAVPGLEAAGAAS